MNYHILVENLTKVFRIPKPDLTKWEKFKNIFVKQRIQKTVLDNISFKIKPREIVGYLGLNGAGKSTTIKILTGVLFPTSGKVKVLNFIPFEKRYEFRKQIGVIFGHKSILEWDIKAIESLKLFASIYELSNEEFKARLQYFDELLGLEKYYKTPVRKLSLGERMRFEIAANFLHKPKIVFLDEPTLGLDIFAKDKIRNFLLTINKKEKTTIFLTTHYMEDVEKLCKRAILLHQGKIIYDGSLQKLKEKFVKEKRLLIKFSSIKNKNLFQKFISKFNVVRKSQNVIVIRTEKTKEAIEKAFSCLDIIDVIVREPNLEAVIKNVYKERT